MNNLSKDIRTAVKMVPITFKEEKIKKEKEITVISKKKISHQKSTFQPVKSRFKRNKPGYKVIKVKSKNGNN